MKTFEENYTAWVDGHLTGAELEVFERELLQNDPGALADKEDAHRLGEMLRRQSPPLSNPDFFNHQIMHRIAVDSTPARRAWRWSWALPQMAWAGAASLLVAVALFKTLIPAHGPGPGADPYFAEIVDVRPADPSISATPVYNARDNVTILWLDGLDYLPASYKLQ
jgi:hypothetical protein